MGMWISLGWLSPNAGTSGLHGMDGELLGDAELEGDAVGAGVGVAAEHAVSPAAAATTSAVTAPNRAMFLFILISLFMVLCSGENT